MFKKAIMLCCCFLFFIVTLLAKDRAIEFIENKRQFPHSVLFKAELPGGAVFLKKNGFRYSYYNEKDLERVHELKHEGKEVQNEPVHLHAYDVYFANCEPNPDIIGSDRFENYHNYFIGNDTSKWAGRVPLFKNVLYKEIYKGIDAKVYSQGQSLKYDFIVHPGFDPGQIVLGFDGVKPKILKDGSLKLTTSVNTVIERPPYVYQIINGQIVQITCNYKPLPGNKIGFDFPKGYDTAFPLIIDPVLVFSTFSGSNAVTYGFSATYDIDGNLYAGGECFSVGWPVTTGAYQTTFGGSVDAGINKYNANGSALLYSTYYGGVGQDLPNNMMVNDNKELVVCGTTTSTNLAVTPGCYSSTFGGATDIFVARFSVNGDVLLAATYLGGTSSDGKSSPSLSPNYGDGNRGEVLTASDGTIYIASCTHSADFPTTAGAFQPTLGGNQDGIVCRLDSDLSTLLYSTFLGGPQEDACFSLVLNSNQEVVVCGGTKSSAFPTTPGSLLPSFQGMTDGFVSVLNLNSGLVSSTFLGTQVYDHAFKVQIDKLDNIFVLGQTRGNYPVSPNAYYVPNGNIFIDKLSPDLSISLASTRMGNSNNTLFVPTAFMHDNCGNVFFSGFNTTLSNPLSFNAYQSTQGGIWIGALTSGFSNLLYGTFFGPMGSHLDGGTSRFDPEGIIYQSICTSNNLFPTTPGAYAPTKQSAAYWDIASFKFDMEISAVSAAFKLANNASDSGCADYTVNFQNMSLGATNFLWLFGDGHSSTAVSPQHTFGPGIHTVLLIAYGPEKCNLSDTATRVLYVQKQEKPIIQVLDTFLCSFDPIQLEVIIENWNSEMSYEWQPTNAIIGPNNQHQVLVDPTQSTDFSIKVINDPTSACKDSAQAYAHISVFDYSTLKTTPTDTIICPGDTIVLRAIGGGAYLWSPQIQIDDIESPSPRVWPNEERVYKVWITSESGCMAERFVNILFHPEAFASAGKDKIIKRGTSTLLDGKANGAFFWTPSIFPLKPNPEVSPSITTTYTLTAVTTENCFASDSVTVYVTDAWVPNAFSPNGDGKNDLFFVIPQDDNVSLKEFSIYNRYGERVFFTQDVHKGWDGNFNGNPSDLGTYFYIATYIIGEKAYTIKGDVTLVR